MKWVASDCYLCLDRDEFSSTILFLGRDGGESSRSTRYLCSNSGSTVTAVGSISTICRQNRHGDPSMNVAKSVSFQVNEGKVILGTRMTWFPYITTTSTWEMPQLCSVLASFCCIQGVKSTSEKSTLVNKCFLLLRPRLLESVWWLISSSGR